MSLSNCNLLGFLLKDFHRKLTNTEEYFYNLSMFFVLFCFCFSGRKWESIVVVAFVPFEMLEVKTLRVLLEPNGEDVFITSIKMQLVESL